MPSTGHMKNCNSLLGTVPEGQAQYLNQGSMAGYKGAKAGGLLGWCAFL